MWIRPVSRLREVRDLAHPEISPALAASYDEHIARAGSLAAARPGLAMRLFARRIVDVSREAMPTLRSTIQALQAFSDDPSLAIVAEDVAAVMADLAGEPRPPSA